MKKKEIFGVVLIFVLLGLLAVHSLNSINQDIGRHLKSGQIIWETKNVYKTNLFSFTEPEHPFVNHHWLSEVIFYLLYGVVGLKGLIFFKAGVLLLAFGVVFLAIRRQISIWMWMSASLVFIPVFIYRSDVRPEIFSYLFFSFFLFAILRTKWQDKKWFFALPLVQILWTNMHIYFAIGPGLLFLFSIDRLFNARREFKKIFILFLATSAATLLNPNFLTGALEPFNILRNYGYSIVENQSVFFLRDYGIQLNDIKFFELSLAVLMLSFILAFRFRQKNNLPNTLNFELMAAVIFTIIALKMIRNFGIYALVALPITTLNLSHLRRSSAPLIRKLGLGTLWGFSVWFAFSVPNNDFYDWSGSAKRFGTDIPDGAATAVEFIKQNRIRGPVFNNFDVGSFLIWKLYPAPGEKCPDELKKPALNLYDNSEKCGVFVDGRPESYSAEFFEKIYKPMQENPELWKEYSEQYGINYVFFGHSDITPWARTFLSLILQNQNWPLIYHDDSVVIFAKRTPLNEELIGKFRKQIKENLNEPKS